MEDKQTQQPQEAQDTAARPARSSGKDLKLRMITGTLYALVLVGFFLLKIFVNELFFDGLILVFAFFGTFEMIRAFKDKLHISQKVLILIFALGIIVAYAVSDYHYSEVLGIGLPGQDITEARGRNYSMHITFIVLIAGMAVLASLLVFAHKHVTLESTGYALLCYVYPAFFLLVITICNHLEYYSELAIMIVFVVAPFADVFAFFFGKLFGKKLPAKMAPNISPKKTVIGGLGGLLGGAVGAVAIFFIYYGLMKADAGLLFQPIREIAPDATNLVFFIALGILTAAFSQFGDLVESAIKRKLGIKDMGKILPGHGGVLDRIDSSLYAGLIVCIALVAKLMLFG